MPNFNLIKYVINNYTVIGFAYHLTKKNKIFYLNYNINPVIHDKKLFDELDDMVIYSLCNEAYRIRTNVYPIAYRKKINPNAEQTKSIYRY
jgi:hypothetical protein